MHQLCGGVDGHAPKLVRKWRKGATHRGIRVSRGSPPVVTVSALWVAPEHYGPHSRYRTLPAQLMHLTTNAGSNGPSGVAAKVRVD